MGKFYILSQSYSPNTAETNHYLSFVRGFDQLGIGAQWIFLNTDGKDSVVPIEYRNIDIKYLWKKYNLKLNKIRTLFTILHKHYSYGKFVSSLKKDDVVLLLGMPAYVVYLSKIKQRRGFKLYHERTESPEIVKASAYKYFCNQYMDSCKNLDGLFVICKNLKDYYVSKGCDEKIVHVINMVVDTTRFEGLQKQWVSPYIAYCGTVQNKKDGADILIKAYAIVHQKHPDIKLYVIGPIRKGSENNELLDSLGLRDSVVFTGAVPAHEMPQLLKNAMILALARPTSKQATYGFPTKLGEYLLSENPIVVTAVGNIPDYLQDKVSAIIAQPDNVQSFAECLTWAIEHPEQAKTIGINGRNVAERNFNYLTETRKMVEKMNLLPS